MAGSPAEAARVQMQSDRARGVSLHRPMPGLVPSQLPWVPGTAVRFSFLLQLYEGAEDTCTTVGPPWPDLFRPPTSLNAAPATAGKAWMAGRSPAKGISGCIERVMNSRFRSTGATGQTAVV
jgi:hypothetical protein